MGLDFLSFLLHDFIVIVKLLIDLAHVLVVAISLMDYARQVKVLQVALEAMLRAVVLQLIAARDFLLAPRAGDQLQLAAALVGLNLLILLEYLTIAARDKQLPGLDLMARDDRALLDMRVKITPVQHQVCARVQVAGRLQLLQSQRRAG